MIILYILLIAFAILYLMPVYVGMNTSLKSEEELAEAKTKLVSHPTIAGYEKAWERMKGNLLNSLEFTIPATLISTFLGSLTGYIFSKFRFKGATILFFIVVLGFYVPPQSIVVPLMKFLTELGLYGSIYGLIFTHVALGIPICTLLWRNYYVTIPDDVVESAQVAGAGIGGIYKRIILPLSLPGFVVVGIFQFVNIWNEFFIGLSITQGAGAQPLTIAVANLTGTTVAAWNVHMAGVMIMLIPPIVIFVLLRKYLVRGLMAGAVKG